MDYLSKNNIVILSVGLAFLYITYKSDNSKIVKVPVQPQTIKKSPIKDEKKEDKKDEKKEEKKEDKKEKRKEEDKKESKKSPKKDDVPYISKSSKDD